MKFYLKYVNPAISILLFLLCTWAAISDKSITWTNIVVGSFSTYFFAKGLYTSASLFILGRILLEILYRNPGKTEKTSITKKVLFTGAFLTFFVGSLTGLYLWGSNSAKIEENKYVIKNPKELIITESYPIRESDQLKIGGKIDNTSDEEFKETKISAKLYIGNRYTDIQSTIHENIEPKSAKEFLIEFSDIRNLNIKDSIRYEFILETDKNNKK
jgi:hypothetical protein